MYNNIYKKYITVIYKILSLQPNFVFKQFSFDASLKKQSFSSQKASLKTRLKKYFQLKKKLSLTT